MIFWISNKRYIKQGSNSIFLPTVQTDSVTKKWTLIRNSSVVLVMGWNEVFFWSRFLFVKSSHWIYFFRKKFCFEKDRFIEKEAKMYIRVFAVIFNPHNFSKMDRQTSKIPVIFCQYNCQRPHPVCTNSSIYIPLFKLISAKAIVFY